MIHRTDRLTAATLAQFDGGMTWKEIVGMTNGRATQWWRKVVILAEEDGLLRWKPARDGEPGRWHLTPVGRGYVQAHAVGSA